MEAPLREPFPDSVTHLTVDARGARLHVAGGPGDPLPGLFLVPGYTDHIGRYTETFDWFRAHGHPVWGMDPRGHGRSSGKRGYLNRFSEYLDDLEASLEAAVTQSGLKRWVLLAHSTGGLTVLSALIRRPEQLAALGVCGVVVTSPLLAIRLQPPRWRTLLGRVASRLVPGLSLDAGVPSYPSTSDPLQQRAKEEDPLVFREVNARWYTEVQEEMAHVRAHAGPLPVPVLALLAGLDPVVDPDVAEAFFTTCRVPVIRYPGMYHEILVETERQKVWRDISNWLVQLETPEPPAALPPPDPAP
ncbi:MAG: lysophospholipase [Nitrospirota bacterium]|nr:lysophospholipase [Nitrospirota bacterium]